MAVRTCIICRSSAEKWELLRLVADGSTLVVDRNQSRPGRGAYIHSRAECLSRMAQISRWNRALRLDEHALEAPKVAALARELLDEVTKGGVDSGSDSTSTGSDGAGTRGSAATGRDNSSGRRKLRL